MTWAVPGPCSPWADSQDVWTCCGQPMTTVGDGTMAVECPVDMTQYAIAASQLLYELDGRQHAGVCIKTVRPCSDRWCGFQILSRGYVVDWQAEVGWSGGNWSWNGDRGCGCQPLDRILLSGYPVRAITEVKIDGVVIDPSEYRLDERRWLIRMADAEENMQFWPNCQRMDMDDTEAGTFSVTYTYGQDPPVSGILAAAQLACELYKGCTPGSGECMLPSGVTRIVRQGVTIDRALFLTWAFVDGRWKTGLPLVDAFLGASNRAGIMRRPTFYSPSGKRYARSVGQ